MSQTSTHIVSTSDPCTPPLKQYSFTIRPIAVDTPRALDVIHQRISDLSDHSSMELESLLSRKRLRYPFVWPIGSHFSKPIKFGAYLPEKPLIGSKTMAANRPDEGILTHTLTTQWSIREKLKVL